MVMQNNDNIDRNNNGIGSRFPESRAHKYIQSAKIKAHKAMVRSFFSVFVAESALCTTVRKRVV